MNFQTEAGLKLALGAHKAIPPTRGKQHEGNTDLCRGPWVNEQKRLYRSVIKHNILVGLSCASWFAFRGKRHRKRSIKTSTYPSTPQNVHQIYVYKAKKAVPRNLSA